MLKPIIWYLLEVKKISCHAHKTGYWYLLGVLFNSCHSTKCDRYCDVIVYHNYSNKRSTQYLVLTSLYNVMYMCLKTNSWWPLLILLWGVEAESFDLQNWWFLSFFSSMDSWFINNLLFVILLPISRNSWFPSLEHKRSSFLLI